MRSWADPPPMSREAARKLAERLESPGPAPIINSETELRLIVRALRYYGAPDSS